MIEHRASGEVVGAIDIFDFSPADRRAEVGIVIDAAYRGRGYAREALALLCDYAQRVLALHQLYCYVFVNNVPARHLFGQNGFSEVAILKDWVHFDGHFCDVCLYQQIF